MSDDNLPLTSINDLKAMGVDQVRTLVTIMDSLGSGWYDQHPEDYVGPALRQAIG